MKQKNKDDPNKQCSQQNKIENKETKQNKHTYTHTTGSPER